MCLHYRFAKPRPLGYKAYVPFALHRLERSYERACLLGKFFPPVRCFQVVFPCHIRQAECVRVQRAVPQFKEPVFAELSDIIIRVHIARNNYHLRVYPLGRQYVKPPQRCGLSGAVTIVAQIHFVSIALYQPRLLLRHCCAERCHCILYPRSEQAYHVHVPFNHYQLAHALTPLHIQCI